MEEIFKKIVRPEIVGRTWLDGELLQQHTRKMNGLLAATIRWKRVRHLHLIASWEAADAGIRSGCYADETGQWVMLVGSASSGRHINPFHGMLLHSCGPELETLHVRGEWAMELHLHAFTGLKALTITENSLLASLQGLDKLTNLETLILRDSSIQKIVFPDSMQKLRLIDLRYNQRLSELQGLSFLSALQSLNLYDTAISRIHLTDPLPQLRFLNAAETHLEELDFLPMTPHLETLRVYNNSISSLPPLSGLTSLKRLDVENCSIESLEDAAFPQGLVTLCLAKCPIKTLDGVKLPETLQQLDLGGTKISRLPNSIMELTDLTNLDIHDLKLEDLPDWLPKLGLTIGEGKGYGVNLENSEVSNMDMSILDRPQKMIHAWFKARASERARHASIPDPEIKKTYEEVRPLNELKVVFLGDGGSGKSRTIARLLEDGANTEDFPNFSTPGIVIQDKAYTIGEREIQIHFWDFGGQDILHSMHRMFLTERTLYVVMLNVRDGTQTERGRYWLHNIRSFAGSAPVLLVLNQIDTNRNASVNEPDLRSLYPALTEVVRMSALEDTPQAIQENLIAALMRQISVFPTLESPFLPSWSRLKDRLSSMEDYYIKGATFTNLCAECGVEEDEEIRLALLRWFSDLGISFHYSSSKNLADYVILRPDWITNAIYTIIFNKSDQVKNGLISQNAIYELLSSDSGEIRRAIPEMTYQPQEVDYVLGVVRKFRLSFQVSDELEFIPMLCQANSLPIAAEYERDPETLEFRMEYDYLPNNVLHRLMVDLRSQLDTDQVWLTGALFRVKDCSLSAVVKTEGDVLRLFVRGENPLHSPHTYLSILRNALEHIHRDLGLTEPKAFVVYKRDGKAEKFSYRGLVGTLERGGAEIYAESWDRMIPIADILNQTDREVARAKKQLLEEVAAACLRLSGQNFLWTVTEDDRNTYLRDLLRSAGRQVSDQSLVGLGAGGKRAGEVDLMILNDRNLPWVACEALNIAGGGRTRLEYWNEHLNKLLVNYNPAGMQDLILISYVATDADRFAKLWSEYSEHMRWYDPSVPNVLRREGTYRDTNILPERYGSLRTACCTYDCGGTPVTVHHYFLRLGL